MVIMDTMTFGREVKVGLSVMVRALLMITGLWFISVSELDGKSMRFHENMKKGDVTNVEVTVSPMNLHDVPETETTPDAIKGNEAFQLWSPLEYVKRSEYERFYIPRTSVKANLENARGKSGRFKVRMTIVYLGPSVYNPPSQGRTPVSRPTQNGKGSPGFVYHNYMAVVNGVVEKNSTDAEPGE